MCNRVVKYCLVVVMSVAIFTSCNRIGNESEEVAAQVGDKILTYQEIGDVVPDDVQEEDSIAMADDYINKWIKTQLMVQKAEENLSVDQRDLSKELEEYRNSLIIYRYKNELMRQRMDTTVTEAQILDYYDANQQNFRLNENIVKAIFVKIPEEFADPQYLKGLCENPTEEDIIELRDFCIQYAKNYDIFTDRWVQFNLVLRNMPTTIENPQEFLQANNIIELNDEGYYYLLSIQDYKLRSELAPVEFVKDNIRNLIINSRKIEFLNEVEDNIYTEGIRKNSFRINKRETNEIE